MTKLLALLLACLAIGLVACGGDDDESGGGGDTGAATTEEPADTGDTGGGAGGDTEVGMENLQFNPSEVTINAGDTITFTNNEEIPHDVHKESGPGADFSSGPDGGMQGGDTFELTLDEPGEYEFVCHVHASTMTGTITVN